MKIFGYFDANIFCLVTQCIFYSINNRIIGNNSLIHRTPIVLSRLSQ